MLQLVPTSDGPDDASVRRELLGRKRVIAFCEQNFNPSTSTSKPVGVSAVFGNVTVKPACLALSTWAYRVVVAFWVFRVLAVTQSAYMFRTQMAGW